MKASEPQFDSQGYLADKVHQFTVENFIERFCSNESASNSVEKTRLFYAQPINALYKWATNTGVTSLVIGGSFITKEPDPNDIDVLVLFSKGATILLPSKDIVGPHAIIDAQILSEDEPELLQAYIQLLGTDRRGIGRGVVQIKLHPNVADVEKKQVDLNLLLATKISYGFRSRMRKPSDQKLVIPIHGIRSNADWVPRFTLMASLAGWSIAPFVYGFESGSILRDEKRKGEVVNEFRVWINEIRKIYQGTISIVAHSFGTYILGRYMQDAGFLGEQFCGIVLAGSILHTGYPWAEHLNHQRVITVLNTTSANDEWVKMLPDGGIKHLASDSLMGAAAVNGFQCKHPRLIEIRSNLLNHSNMFEADVISRQWLPFLDIAEKHNKLAHSLIANEDLKIFHL